NERGATAGSSSSARRGCMRCGLCYRGLQIGSVFPQFRRLTSGEFSMKYVKFLLLAGVLPLAALPGDANANAYYTRQHYSDWHPYGNCYYRDYYYKPSIDYCGYHHHYVMWYPSHPNYYYFFNPYKHAFWGRCPCECHGQEQYSLLPEQFRKPDLAQIPESAF